MTNLPELPIRALLLSGASLLAACNSAPPVERAAVEVIAGNRETALVYLQPGQQYRDIAAALLNDPAAAWQLAELNSGRAARAGEVIAVPLQPVNPTSVYSDGYRTLPILCYHRFTARSRASHQLELTAAAFEQQLRYLVENQYQFLSFAEVADILRQGQPIPDRAVVLTIDDGYASVYDVAWPLLQKYQARATVFIYTDFIGAGAALNWSQLQTMAKSGLIEIQSHGKSHTSLSRLPQDESPDAYSMRLLAEVTGSREQFQRHLGVAPVHLSYPYGNSSETAVRTLQQAGYQLAATVTRGDNTTLSNPYLLHRTMIYDHHDMDDFAGFVQGFKRAPLH
ncbi:polysaccharide deacetylase family protein [Kineobactrum salinum]|uniref:Polysaccharide deacetylase family protein n=1 Tax=Kineobactrum salinum TaxID=2708301 RepID=A0A6C0U209_9GAMM|nr:polysaccharide deacetylase family protein [Kineobactrum salinum]QIB66056.1 polysaccharide deacetylase family protein [Kineobactrum salinum]